MRNLRTRVAAAAGLFAVGATLAACSSGEEPVAAPKATTDPLVTWAGQVCAAVASATEPMEAAEVDHEDPAATIQAYADMFGRMSQLLTRQVTQVEAVGAPPATGLAASYDDAVARLEKAQKVTHRAQVSLASADPGQGAEAALADTGDLTVDGTSYPGFVADVAAASPEVAAAMGEAPACDTFVSP